MAWLQYIPGFHVLKDWPRVALGMFRKWSPTGGVQTLGSMSLKACQDLGPFFSLLLTSSLGQ